jgi:hypothetical protein
MLKWNLICCTEMESRLRWQCEHHERPNDCPDCVLWFCPGQDNTASRFMTSAVRTSELTIAPGAEGDWKDTHHPNLTEMQTTLTRP